MSGTEHTVDGQTRVETIPDPMITSNTAKDGTDTLERDSMSPAADPVISKLKDEAGVPDTASLSTEELPTVMAKSPRATPLRIDSPGTRTPLIDSPPATDDLEENPLAGGVMEKEKPEDDAPVPPEDILTPPPGATFAPFPTSDKASDKASEHDDIPETSKEEAAESTPAAPAAAAVDEEPKELSAPPPEAEETAEKPTEKPSEASLASEAPELKSEEEQPLEQLNTTHVETSGTSHEPREELQIDDDNLSRAVEAGHPLAGVESDLLDDTTTLGDTATIDTDQTLAAPSEKADEIPSEHASITPMVSKDPEESAKLAEQAKEADEHAPVAPSDFLRPEKAEEHEHEQDQEQEQPSEHASLVPQVSKEPEESQKLEEQEKEAEATAPVALLADEKPHAPESTPNNELAGATQAPHAPVEDLNQTDDAIAVAAKEEEAAEDKSEAPLVADTGVVAEEAPPVEAPSAAEQPATEEQEQPVKLVEEQTPEEPAIAEEHPTQAETKIQELAAATTVGAPVAAVLEHQRRSEEEEEKPIEQELEKEDETANITAGPIEGISKDEEGGITLGSGISEPIVPTEASPFEEEKKDDDGAEKLGQGTALAGGAALAAAGVAAATHDDDDEKPTEETPEEQEKPSHNLLAGQMTPPAEVGTPRTQELLEAEEGHSMVPIPQETDVPLTDSNTMEAALNPTAEGAALAVGEHVAEPADAPTTPPTDEQPLEGEPQTPSALIPQQGGTGLASDILSRKDAERRESSAEYPPESFKQEAAQAQEPESAVEETQEQPKEEEEHDDHKAAKIAAAGAGAAALGGAAAVASSHDSEEPQEPVQSKFYEHENDPVEMPPLQQDEKQIPHDGPVEAPLIAPTDAPLDGPLGTDESIITDVSTVGAPAISGERESLDHFNEQRNPQEAEESPMELKEPPAHKPMEVSNEEFGRNTGEPTATETPAGAAPAEAVGVPVGGSGSEEKDAAIERFGTDTPMPEDDPSNSLDLTGAKEKVPEEILESKEDEEISQEETGTPVIEKLEDPAEVEKNKHEEEEPVEEIIASSPTLERADEKDGHGHEEPTEHALDHKVDEEKKEEEEKEEEDKGLGDKIKAAAAATAGAVGLGALVHQLTKDDDEKEEEKEAEKPEDVTEAPKEEESAAIHPTEQETTGEKAIVHDENAVPTEEDLADKPVEQPAEVPTTEEEPAPIHPTEKEAATESQLAFAENAVPVASLAGRTIDEQPSTDSTTDLVSATEVAHAADDAGVAPGEGAETHKEGDHVVVVPDHHEAHDVEPTLKAPEEQPSTDSTASLVEATEVAHAADDAGVSPEEGAEVHKDEGETPVVIPEHHEAVEAEPVAKPVDQEEQTLEESKPADKEQTVDESSILATSEEQPEELKKLEDDPELQREVEADPELAEQVHMPTADQIKHEEQEAHLQEVIAMPTSDQIKHEEEEAALQDKVEMPTSDQIKHEEEEAALQEKVEMPTADEVTKEDKPAEAAVAPAPEEHEAPKDVHFYQAPVDDKHVEEEPIESKDVHYGETAKAQHDDTTEPKDEEHSHDKLAATGAGAAALGAGAFAVHTLGDHKEEAPQVPVETTAPEESGVEEPIIAPDAPEEKVEETPAAAPAPEEHTTQDDLVAAAPEEEIKKDLLEDEPIAAVAPEDTKTEEPVVEEQPTISAPEETPVYDTHAEEPAAPAAVEKESEVTEEPTNEASTVEPAAPVASEPETKEEELEVKTQEPEALKEEELKEEAKDVAGDHAGAIAGTAAALGVAGGAAAAMASKDDDKKDERHDEEDEEEEDDEHHDEDGKPKKRRSLLKRVKDKAKHALHRDHHEEEAKPKEHKEDEHKEDIAAAAPVEREAPIEEKHEEEKKEEEPVATPTKEASTHHAGAGLAAGGTLGTIGTLHEATKQPKEPEQPQTIKDDNERIVEETDPAPTTEMPMAPAPTLEGPTHEDHANASPDITVLRSHPGQNIGESFVIPPADSGEGLVFDDALAKEIDATNRGELSKEGATEPEKPVEPIETPAAKSPEAPEETAPAAVDKTAEERPTTAEGPSDASEGHYALHKDDTPSNTTEQTPATESTPSSAAPATVSGDVTPRVMGHETSTELLRKLYVSPEALDEAAVDPSQTSSMKERGLLADDVKTLPAEGSDETATTAEATTTSAAPVDAPEGSELRQRKEPAPAEGEEAGPSSNLDDRPGSKAGTMTSTRQKNMMQAFWGVFFLGFFGGIGRFFTGMFGKKKA